MKHTPGPWASKKVTRNLYQVSVTGQHSYHIGTVRGEHNATLVATAPDLLHALQQLQANPNDPRNHRLAMDVITKATGETT